MAEEVSADHLIQEQDIMFIVLEDTFIFTPVDTILMGAMAIITYITDTHNHLESWDNYLLLWLWLFSFALLLLLRG